MVQAPAQDATAPSHLAHTPCPDTHRSPWHRAANSSVPPVLDKGLLSLSCTPAAPEFSRACLVQGRDSPHPAVPKPRHQPQPAGPQQQQEGTPQPKGMGYGTGAVRPCTARGSAHGSCPHPGRTNAGGSWASTCRGTATARRGHTACPGHPDRIPADTHTRGRHPRHGRAPHLRLGARILPRRAPPHRAGHRGHRAGQHRARHRGHRAGPPGPRRRCRAGPACAGEAALRHRPAPPASASPPPPPCLHPSSFPASQHPSLPPSLPPSF